MDKSAPPNPIIHIAKLFDGEDPQEIHRRLAWGDARCTGCKGIPVCRIQVFIAVDDMPEPHRSLARIAIGAGELKAVTWAGRQSILASRVFACALCQRAAKIAAARGPSYGMIDIDNGPAGNRPAVSVARAIS